MEGDIIKELMQETEQEYPKAHRLKGIVETESTFEFSFLFPPRKAADGGDIENFPAKLRLPKIPSLQQLYTIRDISNLQDMEVMMKFISTLSGQPKVILDFMDPSDMARAREIGFEIVGKIWSRGGLQLF